MTRSRPWRRAHLAVILLAAMLGLGTLAPAAHADQTEGTILEDDPLVLAHPESTLMAARELGVTILRLDIPWGEIAPSPTSWTRPQFNAADPAAYKASAWGPFDAVITTAHSLGITVDLDLAPGAPRWATNRDQPRNVNGYPHWQWEPNAAQYGLFAQAAGERYSGNWNPVTQKLDPGNANDLPRVSFWSIWNEPNYGPSLAPQGLPGHPGIEDSPRMYRALVDDAWSGLARSGHTTPADTILIGELAPRSQLTAPGHFNTFNGMTPMVFLENLYCVDTSFKPLRGAAASIRGCPASAGGSRRFIADNPGLFDNSGVADHPYDEWFAPDQELDIPKLPGWALENTQDTSLATIGVLERGLNRLTAAYGDREQLPIWDTEYGYQTSPPHRVWSGDKRPWPSETTAAYYDNWAEYLHWKNPRIKSFSQYLIQDAVAATQANDYGAFPSGLISYNGTPKAGLAAFRMPLYLPRTTVASPYTAVEVWGGARPAPFAMQDVPGSSQTGTVTLQFEAKGSTYWSQLATVAVNAEGYYDEYETFPASGTLRAEWSVPDDSLLTLGGTTIYSRSVQVTVN